MMSDAQMSQIEQNHERMQWMKDNFGDDYLERFGQMVLLGHSIQQAIDRCWSYYQETEKQ